MHDWMWMVMVVVMLGHDRMDLWRWSDDWLRSINDNNFHGLGLGWLWLLL